MMVKRFDTSNYEVNGPLHTGKNKKVIELMRDELGREIMTEFFALRLKTYSYLMYEIVIKKLKELKNVY